MKTCIKCKKEYPEEEMVPGKNICYTCDNILNLSRKYDRKGRKTYNVQYQRYVNEILERIHRGEKDEKIIEEIAPSLPENPKDRISCACKLYLYARTQATSSDQSHLTPKDWERLKDLYWRYITHYDRTRRNGHKQREGTQRALFPDEEKRYKNGKIKPKRLRKV